MILGIIMPMACFIAAAILNKAIAVMFLATLARILSTNQHTQAQTTKVRLIKLTF